VNALAAFIVGILTGIVATWLLAVAVDAAQRRRAARRRRWVARGRR
jgi:preprotein translocase subunit SecF